MTSERVRTRRFNILAMLWAARCARKPLPTVRELSRQFGVSLQVTYCDLQALIALGYVTQWTGEGCRPSRSYFPLVGAIHELRRNLWPTT